MSCKQQTIALLNNEAVSLLASGSTGRAFKTFKSALGLLNVPTTPNSMARRTRESNQTEAPKLMGFAPIATSFDDDAEYYVYTRPYLFNSGETPFEIHLHSAVIMFNMALTLHIKGKRSCDKAMKSALNMYNKTLLILEEASETPECRSILVATLNNQAQIYYSLCQFDKAKELLSILLEAISSPEERSAFHESDIEEFLQNHVLLGTSAAAPAA